MKRTKAAVVRGGRCRYWAPVFLAITACSAVAPSALALDEIDADRLPLPPAYDRSDEGSSVIETVPLEWSRVESGASTDNNCPQDGDGVVWQWTNDPTDTGVGDPDVRLYLCDVGEADVAREVFHATPLERTVLVLTSTPLAVSTEAVGLNADESKMACVRRTTDLHECSAWSYIGRYGPHLVTLTYESSVTRSNLSEDVFTQLAAAVDALVAGVMEES